MTLLLAAWRRHYAAKANTFDECIRYWCELTPAQQERAAAQFSGYDLPGHVYQIGNEGQVISRQRLHWNDPSIKVEA